MYGVQGMMRDYAGYGMTADKAKELLAGDGGSMKEICGAVGYSDPNYFSRIFKKWTGQTRTEFKEGNEE